MMAAESFILYSDSVFYDKNTRCEQILAIFSPEHSSCPYSPKPIPSTMEADSMSKSGLHGTSEEASGCHGPYLFFSARRTSRRSFGDTPSSRYVKKQYQYKEFENITSYLRTDRSWELGAGFWIPSSKNKEVHLESHTKSNTKIKALNDSRAHSD